MSASRLRCRPIRMPVPRGRERALAPMGLPPWHMWGSSAVLQSAAAGTVVSPQLARINYGRPDCWRFLAAVKLPNGTPVGSVITINFKAILGVGRSSALLSPIAQFLPPASMLPGATSWQTRSFQPNFDGTLTNTNPDDQMVAQDIQGWAEATFNASAINTPVEVYLSWAPNVHIRPEWYRGEFEENFEE